MAVAGNCRIFQNIVVLLLLLLLLLSLCRFGISENNIHVHEFDKQDVLLEDSLITNKETERSKRSAESTPYYSESPGSDSTCKIQNKDHLSEFTGPSSTKKLEKLHIFDNDDNSAVAVTWAGQDDVLIVVTTTENPYFFTISGHSCVYRSTDNGLTFTNISSKVENAFIRKSAGLQRNIHNPQKVYLISPNKDHYNIYITEDGGINFSKHKLPFALDGTFKYHPHRDNWMMARSLGQQKNLYISVDNGKTWSKIVDNVADFKWATPGSQDNWGPCLYATESPVKQKTFFDLFKPSLKRLKKSCDHGKTWNVLANDVFSFGVQGKFLFVSVKGEKTHERIMKVSTNGGKSFAVTQLPTIYPDQFYSILDMSEGVVFIHVDKPGDTGHGNLYMSAADGIIFTKVLDSHLYPNIGGITDFYPVRSLRGVYITSQMLKDNSIRTVISYNRGASWSPIRRPKNGKCKDESKDCNLQLHNSYSLSRRLPVERPLSERNAVGLILAHGHIADTLQTTPPDVFVSDDGGYSWILALKGPHRYKIADNGGLLVALSKESKTNQYIKFSTDEGRCWHSYRFANEPMIVTGLLTEPGAKSATIAIWGYGSNDKKWRTFMIDFTKVVTKKCSEGDYSTWQAHSAFRSEERGNMAGCLLGVSESFTRINKDSWCLNGYTFKPVQTISKCKCTREDFECEYGYTRPVGSDYCVKDSDVKSKIDICLKGEEFLIKTDGYRTIPGDNCTGGDSLALKEAFYDLHKKCSGKQIVDETIVKVTDANVQAKPDYHSRIVLIGGIVGALLGALVLFIITVFVYRYYIANRRIMNYRYSLLHHKDDFDYDGEFENALSSTSNKFEDTEEQINMKTSPERNGRAPQRYHDDSDEEMLE